MPCANRPVYMTGYRQHTRQLRSAYMAGASWVFYTLGNSTLCRAPCHSLYLRIPHTHTHLRKCMTTTWSYIGYSPSLSISFMDPSLIQSNQIWGVVLSSVICTDKYICVGGTGHHIKRVMAAHTLYTYVYGVHMSPVRVF